MYSDIYMIEKTMEYREHEFRKMEFVRRDSELARKEPFYCKLPVINQLSVCNCS
ncbi:hypothetical protein [Bacillus sp. FJAT-27445]|uniref:hypothetical protein n=1 Tax=Bacillus sp. FJAT-27445 TaxID=1679166 RepID=UPI000B30AE26|nr:hypothetical protein [Bacillus sp. FJAT-27445]